MRVVIVSNPKGEGLVMPRTITLYVCKGVALPYSGEPAVVVSMNDEFSPFEVPVEKVSKQSSTYTVRVW